jgi:hypothetical protein
VLFFVSPGPGSRSSSSIWRRLCLWSSAAAIRHCLMLQTCC